MRGESPVRKSKIMLLVAVNTSCARGARGERRKKGSESAGLVEEY